MGSGYGPGYASVVDGAGNYESGDDYVVEFLGYRFGFNAEDFEQRVTAAAVKLGLSPGTSSTTTRRRPRELVDGTRSRPRSRSAATRSPLGAPLPRRGRVARLLAEEARVPRRMARQRAKRKETSLRGGRRRVRVPRPGGGRALLELLPPPSWDSGSTAYDRCCLDRSFSLRRCPADPRARRGSRPRRSLPAWRSARGRRCVVVLPVGGVGRTGATGEDLWPRARGAGRNADDLVRAPTS